ncbi:MAG: zf-HC2 domain-containing protein [Candidatus Poribacteria bacterium]|nr:zf-HC2 domain-containing protein [Candidatus Poribacteria bacterium]
MPQNLSHEITCTDCQAQIEEYIAGELDTAIESAITSHLATCNTCQHEFNLAQTIDVVLDDLPKPTSPPDILSEVTAYIQTHPHNDNWMDRFFNVFAWENSRQLILRVSALTCLVGIVLFGIHQHQRHVEIEQAKSDFNYAMRKMEYAVHKTGLAVNDSFTSLKIDEASRSAFKSTSKISSAIDKSLGILNRLTGDQPDSETIPPKTKHTNFSIKPNSSIPGGSTQ